MRKVEGVALEDDATPSKECLSRLEEGGLFISFITNDTT